jgi:hypothetical protein
LIEGTTWPGLRTVAITLGAPDAPSSHLKAGVRADANGLGRHWPLPFSLDLIAASGRQAWANVKGSRSVAAL